MSKITSFKNYFKVNYPNLKLYSDYPMSKLTSFRIGGNAELVAMPEWEDEIRALIKISKIMDIPFAILGAGTNVLAPDEGIKGLVICLRGAQAGVSQISKNEICVRADMTMSRVAVTAAAIGLSGLEFAHGIPGTIGGGVYMNAGAYGGEIKDVCTRIRIMDMDGNTRWISNEEAGFSYRHSAIEDNHWIVLEAEFTLTPKPSKEIKEKMMELINKRRASQPLDLPSAGSAFKRPVGGYAAALIDQTGLKGYRVGGAAVSEKHAGFVVNLGGATANDVKQLLKEVSDRVYDAHGIRLEPEVRIW